MSSVEEEVLSHLGDLNVGQLQGIHQEMGLPEIEAAKRNIKSQVLKVLMQYFTSADLEQSEDQGLAKFLWTKKYIDDNSTEAVVVKSEPEGTDVNTSVDLTDLKKALKKDFKIRGTIGLPGQKDKLAFSSLALQIDTAENKGYDVSEICLEVARAVSPELSLRPLLEGKANTLTLAKLRKILRAHYQEKDPTTLFNMLANATQAASEGPLAYVVRLMNLRQKVLFVSKEIDNRMVYPESLVHSQFLRAIVTGLRNDNIRNEIKPFLDDSMEDEELLEIMNKAISDESERATKMKKSAGVNKVTPGDSDPCDSDEKPPPEVKPILKKDNPILAEIRAMRAELKEVRGQKDELAFSFDELRKQLDKKQPQKRRVWWGSCPACTDNNVARCSHCWKCGGAHKKQDCPEN